MSNRSYLFAMLFAVAALPLAAAPGAPRAPSPELRGPECLNPAMARGVTTIDDRSAVIDAGRRLYRIEVTPRCLRSYTSSIMGFRGDPVSQRVCGTPFDAVLVRGGPPCRIERMERISKAEYQLALRERDEHIRALRAERRARRAQARD